MRVLRFAKRVIHHREHGEERYEASYVVSDKNYCFRDGKIPGGLSSILGVNRLWN